MSNVSVNRKDISAEKVIKNGRVFFWHEVLRNSIERGEAGKFSKFYKSQNRGNIKSNKLY